MKQLFVAWLWMLSACSPKNEVDSERTNDQLNESATLSHILKRLPTDDIHSRVGRYRRAA